MVPDNPGVSVRLDPCKVRRAFDRWETKIKPFLNKGVDPAITLAFDKDMRDLVRAVEGDTDANA